MTMAEAIQGKPIGFYKGNKINLGRHHSRATKRKLSLMMSNKGNPMYGKHHSVEIRKKISDSKKGEKNYSWKGGRSKSSEGYIIILKPKHPYATKSGYILEHRFIMEKIIGRYLKPEEIVHHKNKDIYDNRPENLQLYPSHKEHSSFHRRQKLNEKRN